MTDHPGYPGQCCDTSPCTCQDAPLLDLDAIQARADAAMSPRERANALAA